MEKIIIKVTDFVSRTELEDYVKNELGDDISANRTAGHEIQGTEDQLKSFGLSATTRVFGVKCVILTA